MIALGFSSISQEIARLILFKERTLLEFQWSRFVIFINIPFFFNVQIAESQNSSILQ